MARRSRCHPRPPNAAAEAGAAPLPSTMSTALAQAQLPGSRPARAKLAAAAAGLLVLGGVGGYWLGHTTAPSPTAGAGAGIGAHQHRDRGGPGGGLQPPGDGQAPGVGSSAGSGTAASGTSDTAASGASGTAASGTAASGTGGSGAVGSRPLRPGIGTAGTGAQA